MTGHTWTLNSVANVYPCIKQNYVQQQKWYTSTSHKNTILWNANPLRERQWEVKALVSVKIPTGQHTQRTPTYPGSIPQASPNPQMKGIPKHRLLVGEEFQNIDCWLGVWGLFQRLFFWFNLPTFQKTCLDIGNAHATSVTCSSSSII